MSKESKSEFKKIKKGLREAVDGEYTITKVHLDMDGNPISIERNGKITKFGK